ncbi:hypothetical protein N9N67_11515, partial [Bacteriovoracaceae bacterium]|nr:hypothetical protein [Bacteriovoracaceae bacterium]
MKKTNSLSLLLSVFFTFSLTASTVFPPFDQGPNLNEPMEKELLDLIQELPYLPGISTQLQVLAPHYKNGQKMRPDFGAMPVRGFLGKNKIKVLVIGQDGTHIAEGANRPGIAGFGGRVQDIMKHFGIYEGVLFTNLYVNTISGQYGSRNTPIYDTKNEKFLNNNVIENRQWLLTHDGAYSEWRNKFISWVIRNNQKSLRMVVMLGQAGKDAGANFVTSIGAKVQPNDYYIDVDKYDVGNGAHLQVPQFEMVGAGGNNEWAVPQTKDGKDVAEILRQLPDVKERLEKYLESEIERLTIKKDEDIPNRNISMNSKVFLTDKLNKLIAQIRKDIPKKLRAVNNKLNYKNSSSQSIAIDLINAYPEKAKELLVFSKGGPEQNGVLYPQQYGGWDISTMTVKGTTTQSIKGLKVPCNGSKIGKCSRAKSIKAPNVIFVGSPHPTYLSNKERENRGKGVAAGIVKKDLLDVVDREVALGWAPPTPEPGFTSNYIDGIAYKYGRGIIPPSHGDPGITPLRLLPVSTAQRLKFNAQGDYSREAKNKEPRGIVIGTRDRADFDEKKLAKMVIDKPSDRSLMKNKTVLTGRPQIENMIYKYDRGPEIGKGSYSEILFETLDVNQVTFVKDIEKVDTSDLDGDKDITETINLKDFATNYLSTSSAKKNLNRAHQKVYGKIFDAYGVEVFNSKTHIDAGFFGHYRGTFDSPKVVILADPVDWDSFITSKASTGDRGQYLNGLMKDLGVGTEYLVISTVPFGMEGATAKEWKEVLKTTQTYRDQLIAKITKKGKPNFIADGKYASSELKRILGSADKFVTIKQRKNSGKYGIKSAGKAIKEKFGYSGRVMAKRSDIPREHLTWIARLWEGTSGDRVITATDKANKGKAFAIVAPDWARNEKPAFTQGTRAFLRKNWDQLAKAGEPYPGESLKAYAKRRADCASQAEWSSNSSKI